MYAYVHDTRRLSSSMIRIQLAGGDLAEFTSTGFTEHLIGVRVSTARRRRFRRTGDVTTPMSGGARRNATGSQNRNVTSTNSWRRRPDGLRKSRRRRASSRRRGGFLVGDELSGLV